MRNILEKFDLHGRTAVVTGGAGLLGRQFSLALAQAGANVLVADLAQAAADAHALTLREQGLRAEGIGVDVTDPQSTKAMAQAAQEIFGSLDVLVNSAALDPKFDPANAGSQGANAFESYSLDSWRQAFESMDDAGPRKSRSNTAQERKSLAKLQKELERKDKALAEAAALLVLSKKAQAIWGVDGEA